MKLILSLPLLATLASVNAGFLNGAHFLPATNVVSSRTIVGSAVGGGPTSGAVSSAQYSQTVAAPATVHTVITSHPGPNVGYPNSGSSGGANSGNSAGQSSGGGGGGNTGGYGSYIYNTGPTGGTTQGGNSGQGGFGRQGGSSGGGQNSGYGQSPPQPSYYNQRYY